MRRRESECGGEGAEQEEKRDGCLQPHRLISPPILSLSRSQDHTQRKKSGNKKNAHKAKKKNKKTKKKIPILKMIRKAPTPKCNSQIFFPHARFYALHRLRSPIHRRAKREIPPSHTHTQRVFPHRLLYCQAGNTSGRINTPPSSQPCMANRARKMGRVCGIWGFGALGGLGGWCRVGIWVFFFYV